MNIRGESAPTPQLVYGTEPVVLNPTDDNCRASIQLLKEFNDNCGSVRIKTTKPRVPLAIMFAKPLHFVNFPRREQDDYSRWDVIVDPQTGLNAHAMAIHLRDTPLNNTRYVFPSDGVALDQDGFTTDFNISESIAEAIEADRDTQAYELFKSVKPSPLRRWIGKHVLKSLNAAIGDIPEPEKPAPVVHAVDQKCRRPKTPELALYAALQDFAQAQNPYIAYNTVRHWPAVQNRKEVYTQQIWPR